MVEEEGERKKRKEEGQRKRERRKGEGSRGRGGGRGGRGRGKVANARVGSPLRKLYDASSSSDSVPYQCTIRCVMAATSTSS